MACLSDPLRLSCTIVITACWWFFVAETLAHIVAVCITCTKLLEFDLNLQFDKVLPPNRIQCIY